MTDQKIIAVVGATGAQGGGLARAILADPDNEFAVRAITRNPTSDQARALADAGAQVVAADLDDPATVHQAFAGAYGAFCVTNFWEHFSPQKETAQAKTMAEAARAAGLAHTIWSTFEDTRRWVPLTDDRMPSLLERYKVPHFDAKGEADAFFAGVPTTLLLTSFYWENFIYFGMGPKAGPDGQLALTFPTGDAKLPGIAVEDIGRAAYGIFKQGLVDQTIGVAGEHLTGAELAAAFTQALGQPVGFNAVEPEVYRGFGFPGADEMGNMFQFKRDFNDDYVGARDIERVRSLNPGIQAFDQWLAANRDRIPVTS